MRSRPRARRLAMKKDLVPEGARIVLPESGATISGEPQVPSQGSDRWRPDQDDFWRLKSFYKWSNRIWEMFKFASEAGGDAMIPVVADAYANFVEGYNAVKEAFDLYQRGMESYAEFRRRVEQFKRDFPDVPPPPFDVGAPDVPSIPVVPEEPEAGELPPDAYDDITHDLVPTDQVAAGDISPATFDPSGVYPTVDSGGSWVPSVSPSQSYGARAGGRKIHYRVRYLRE